METAQVIKDKLGKKIIDWYQHAARRIYITISPEDIKDGARLLFKALGFRFCIASGIDTPRGFEILYHFSHDATGVIYSLKVLIGDKENPRIESIAHIFKGAEWIEREMWELLGINFLNHPKLERLLLADDWPQGVYPLRRDFK